MATPSDGGFTETGRAATSSPSSDHLRGPPGGAPNCGSSGDTPRGGLPAVPNRGSFGGISGRGPPGGPRPGFPQGIPRGGPPGPPPPLLSELSNTMSGVVVAVEEQRNSRGKATSAQGPPGVSIEMVESSSSRFPYCNSSEMTRSQQLQPVKLAAEDARAFDLMYEGAPQIAGAPPRGLSAVRRISSRLGPFSSSRFDDHLRKGFRSVLLLCSSTGILIFVFLQELVFNSGSFNGRCIGPVLYPPWDDPKEWRMPTLISFGYGACEANLGLIDTSLEMADPETLNPNAGVLGKEHQKTLKPNSGDSEKTCQKPLNPRKRCGWGACAGDCGWPEHLVKGGHMAASWPAFDSPNSRILNVLGALNSNLIRNYGEVYRVFWASFLHGGWIHLTVNLLCQTAVLFILEPVWGFWRCLIAWIISAMSGNLLSAVFDPCSITVGSSGALYGLLGALVPFSIENWDYTRHPWLVFLIFVTVIATAQLANMGGFSAVDHFAHLGGCLGGMLFGFSTIYSLRALRKFSLSVWWSRVRLACCRCCLSSTKRDALRRRLQRHERKTREELKRLPDDGPPFVWRCCEGYLEWIVRLAALTFLVVSLVLMWFYLLDPSYYEPLKTPGRISFLGSVGCNCCRMPSREEIKGDPFLARLPPHHTLRANAGTFWCFESKYHADFFCGKLFKDGTISLSMAAAARDSKT